MSDTVPHLLLGESKGNPRRRFRLDPLMLRWVEGYAAANGLNFSSVVRLAVSRFIQSEITRMEIKGLLDILDRQSRELEGAVLSYYVQKVALAGQLAEQKVVVSSERQQLYDKTLAMMRTLLEIAESKEAAQNLQIKIQAILAANALMRTAETIMRDYERGIAEGHLKQMRDYIEQLREAVQESGQGSGTGTAGKSG